MTKIGKSTIIQDFIDRKKPGTYTVAEIFDDSWEVITNPSEFGKEFKRVVDRGLYVGIRFHSKRSDNSALYAIRQ